MDFIKFFFSLEDYSHASLFEGCRYPWEVLTKLKEYLQKIPLGKMEGSVSPSAFLINPSQITIGSGTVVEPGAYIEGPCFIGKNCKIRHGAYVRAGVILGDGCVIGHGSEVKHSLFLNGASAAHFNYVGDSVLGSGVNLGAGVKCANLRFDHKPISVFLKEEKIDTHLRKLGAILGDGAQVGCNAVLNPGTIFGKNALCFPSLNVGGFVAEGEKVVARSMTC